jgi:hypothetical protein
MRGSLYEFENIFKLLNIIHALVPAISNIVYMGLYMAGGNGFVGFVGLHKKEWEGK